MKARLDAISESHRKVERAAGWAPLCVLCLTHWPCDAAWLWLLERFAPSAAPEYECNICGFQADRGGMDEHLVWEHGEAPEPPREAR
jgi:hypothetical protein